VAEILVKIGATGWITFILFLLFAYIAARVDDAYPDSQTPKMVLGILVGVMLVSVVVGSIFFAAGLIVRLWT
jgi:hypothetical protein